MILLGKDFLSLVQGCKIKPAVIQYTDHEFQLSLRPIIILCRSYYYDTVLNIYQLLYLLTVYNHIPVLQNY
jgi:hypothetical protein